jgi:hypothetical protein
MSEAMMSKIRRDVVRLPFETCRAFRAKMMTHSELVEDFWDRHAEHIGLVVDDRLIATFRVVYPHERRLPISEHFPDLPVDAPDRQIGRLITVRAHWTIESGVYFYRYYVDQFLASPGRIYVANATRGPISTKRYQSLGFVDTGLRYSDRRYAGELSVLVKTAMASDRLQDP